jgi:hypothetical protein
MGAAWLVCGIYIVIGQPKTTITLEDRIYQRLETLPVV